MPANSADAQSEHQRAIDESSRRLDELRQSIFTGLDEMSELRKKAEAFERAYAEKHRYDFCDFERKLQLLGEDIARWQEAERNAEDRIERYRLARNISTCQCLITAMKELQQASSLIYLSFFFIYIKNVSSPRLFPHVPLKLPK